MSLSEFDGIVGVDEDFVVIDLEFVEEITGVHIEDVLWDGIDCSFDVLLQFSDGLIFSSGQWMSYCARQFRMRCYFSRQKELNDEYRCYCD